jgi:hypothetical protein
MDGLTKMSARLGSRVGVRARARRLAAAFGTVAVAVAVWGLAGATPPAAAGVIPATSIDGPSPDIAAVGGMALARDAGGGVVYLKRVGGVAHVFVGLVTNGVWSAPQQIDAGLPGDSAQPVIAAAENGRVAICFLNGGMIYGSVRPNATQGFTPPQAIAAALSDPSVSMGISGAAYVSFTALDSKGANVRAARLDRKGTAFDLLPSALNQSPSSLAGVGAAKRSRVIVSGDGTGLVTWAEDGTDGRTHVHLRRVFGTQVSVVDNDATLASLDGRPGLSADSADVGIQYDSSYGWLTFRQSFNDGGALRSRVVVMELLGSALQPPVAVDSLTFPGLDAADAPRIAINGLGDGLVAAELQGSHAVVAGSESGSGFAGAQQINSSPNTFVPTPVVALGQNNFGLVAWQPDPGSVQARAFDSGTPVIQIVLSQPAFGATDVLDGFGAAADSRGDSAVAFQQGDPGSRRVVVAVNVTPPGKFSGLTTESTLRSSRVRLTWKPSPEVWSPATYTVKIDGVLYGTTTSTQLLTSVPPGRHHWRVTAADASGETTLSPERRLVIDPGKLRAKLTVRGLPKVGGPLRFGVHLRSTDPHHRGIHVRSASIDFGDQTPPVQGVTTSHVYAHPGDYLVLATVTDQAGRTTAAAKLLHITP